MLPATTFVRPQGLVAGRFAILRTAKVPDVPASVFHCQEMFAWAEKQRLIQPIDGRETAFAKMSLEMWGQPGWQAYLSFQAAAMEIVLYELDFGLGRWNLCWTGVFARNPKPLQASSSSFRGAPDSDRWER